VQFEGGYGGTDQLVLDTTTDGKVKVQNPDGTHQWIDKKNVYAYPKYSGEEGGPQQTQVGKLGTSSASADKLNAELATLSDAHASIAAQIAKATEPTVKKKKPVGTPYPGPDGKHVKQPAHLAEQREAQGLKNLKDGYAPAVGQILRHNDGSQYVVIETGDTWSSHKNSVFVYPVTAGGELYGGKWKANSTFVVDHEAMLTDNFGNPLPVINQINGADWSPTSGVLWRRDFTHGYYMTDPKTGKNEYRTKDMSKFYIVAPEGSVYNLDGTKVQPYNVAMSMNGALKVGYVDKEHVGPDAQTLTVSIQPHHSPKVGVLQYAVIHDPGDSPAVILSAQTPDATINVPEAPAVPDKPPQFTPEEDLGIVNIPTEQQQWESAQEAIDKGLAEGKTTAEILDAVNATKTAAPPPTAPPTAPLPPPTPTVGLPPPLPTPTEADLQVFEGKKPSGTEVPHPSTVTSSAGVPVYQSTGGTKLDGAGVPGARSVVSAIDETLTAAKTNKDNNEKKWVSTYGLADHDVIEDMMVQTQVVKDAKGQEFVEVRFRLEHEAARANHLTFITSSVNETGDWEFANRNSKNMVPGDLLAVRVASGGGVTIKGALRPDDASGAMPNATVIKAPELVGKNKAGTYDVWRTQVQTASGDIGWIDLEDRNGTDSVVISYWDATKPRTTNGNKDLNPNAKNDGWSVKSKSLNWDRQTSAEQVDERDAAGIKKIGGNASTQVSGSGWTLQRDYQGAHVEYRTSSEKNSADGQVVIRVPVDDPEAQRKISEAMELVGVSKEKQAPPDKAALTKMATDRVWTQFNPTFTAGKHPNSPQAALDAIDNAVGKQLGRKATMDDISLRISPDGRVQVLVSEDVSRAIVARNGVKAYTHRISGGFDETVKGAVSGENPGLMATTERWSHGLFYFGMSSTADHGHNSADHLFLRMSKKNTTNQTHTLILDPVAIHRHVGYYWQPNDSYGSRQSNQLNWLDPGNGVDNSSNELMIQRRLEPDVWGHVIMSSSERSSMIKELHAQGVTHAPNGLPLEDFFVTEGGAAILPKTSPSFGNEVSLGSLPDSGMPVTAPPAAAPPAVV